MSQLPPAGRSTPVMYNPITHVERVRTPADPKRGPCVCSLCGCGRHNCPGKVQGPKMSSDTAYKEQFPKRDIDSASSRTNIAKQLRLKQLSSEAMEFTKAAPDHFVTVSSAFFRSGSRPPTAGDGAVDARPAGSAPRHRGAAPETVHNVANLPRPQDEAMANKPHDRFVRTAKFDATTTSKSLMPGQYTVTRTTRHAGAHRLPSVQRVLQHDDEDGLPLDSEAAAAQVAYSRLTSPVSVASSRWRTTSQAQQTAVVSAARATHAGRPPAVPPRPQIHSLAPDAPSQRHGSRRGARSTIVEQERPTTSYSAQFGVPASAAAATGAGPTAVRHLRKAPKQPGFVLEADDRDFTTSNGVQAVVTPGSPRNSRRQLSACAAAKYVAQRPDPDGHIHVPASAAATQIV